MNCPKDILIDAGTTYPAGIVDESWLEDLIVCFFPDSEKVDGNIRVVGSLVPPIT